MAAVLEGLISSRRRPSRSRSESGKQLHARWGDAAISAPNGGGWSQQYLEDDPNNVVYQAHGSPDSQKTLVNDSPNLSMKDDVEKVSMEELRQASPPLVQKERGAITITIPLPWSWKSHRRSSSAGRHQAQLMPAAEKTVTTESRPAVSQRPTSIDEVIVAESRPVTESFRANSPIISTQSPVYDDISTFFTRAVFPEKHPGRQALPQIQTQVPINKSQPASALSILSPVAEKYDGLSESNNVTPMDNTPIAQHIASAIAVDANGIVDVTNLADHLERHACRTSSLPPSRMTSPVVGPMERPESRSSSKIPSRPSSRGPGIGEIAYMRASSREPAETNDGRRTTSREPTGRRNMSAEPMRRRASSREAFRKRADSPRGTGGRSYSQEVRDPSREPRSRANRSRDPTPIPIASADPTISPALSLDPIRPRAESPGPTTRRAQSREPSYRRTPSPVAMTRRIHARQPSPATFTRRAISREPVTRRRISVDLARRAISVDPVPVRTSPRNEIIVRKASPREDLILRHPTSPDEVFTRRASPRDEISSRHTTPNLKDSESESSSEDLTSDETTDIETETDEMYFKSRKGWNGPADVGANSNGFYGEVINDYKLIAGAVEADQGHTQGIGVKLGVAPEVGNSIKRDKQEIESHKDVKKYGGPDLVPCHEELWG